MLMIAYVFLLVKGPFKYLCFKLLMVFYVKENTIQVILYILFSIEMSL
jgi:hypothetical protein